MFYRFLRIYGSVSGRKLYSLTHNRSFTTCAAVCWDLVLVKGPNSSFAYKIKTIPIVTLINILERFFQFCNLSGSSSRSELNKKFKLIFPSSKTYYYIYVWFKALQVLTFHNLSNMDKSDQTLQKKNFNQGNEGNQTRQHLLESVKLLLRQMKSIMH